MYSTFAATADADAFDEDSLPFGQAGNTILAMPASPDGVHLKSAGLTMVSVADFDEVMSDDYADAFAPPTHHVDLLNSSFLSGGRAGERQESTDNGTMAHSHVNGQDGSHAPSSSKSTHPSLHLRSLASTGSNTYHSPYPSTKPISSPVGMGKAPSLPVNTNNAETMSETSQLNGKARMSPTPEMSVSSGSSAATSHYLPPSTQPRAPTEFRANSSIPDDMPWAEFARQSILGAESSRLNPFALHPDEYKLLRSHVTRPQVTIYLNIRNAILRLWTRNPLVKVSLEEAAGCARDKAYFPLAEVAYWWLIRKGYINFGCVDLGEGINADVPNTTRKGHQRTILVIGAGMSGLGCARQLEGLSAQLQDEWASRGQEPPKVIVLEGRSRIGGRVYSHPLKNQDAATSPRNHRCTAEMGAQIITGFERGNPINVLVRGQLGIPYHRLTDDTILYDYDGAVVGEKQDKLVESLYNDVLERASIYRSKPASFRTVEGNRKLMLAGREPSDHDSLTIAEIENSNTPLPAGADSLASITESKPSTGVEKLAGRAYQLSAGYDPNLPAATAVRNLGWKLKHGTSSKRTLQLDPVASSSEHPTLGEIMDEGIQQYQTLLDMAPRDLRLLNWHHANLEYANAVNVHQLSLSGWDQDIGNEFEGYHAQVIGGYQQVPLGLWQCPRKLDVRFKRAVKTISYNNVKRMPVRVECHNGEVYEADEVVLTTPLGVLKSGAITFDPPLPSWKQDVIERMGFGLLNKVVLVYEKAFWEPHRDMFGLLNEAEHQASLDIKDYKQRRGRFFLFWNCIKTSGRPMLVALMAGDAAHYAEATSDEDLVKEVTGRLAKMFAPKSVSQPSETIVTRWNRDPFARGSYSYVGPKTQAGDYDLMAQPYGRLHFAGEATCGTHPATVHGAYLSGLRAAGEIIESMLGPIAIPTPLVVRPRKTEPRKCSRGASTPKLNGTPTATSDSNATPSTAAAAAPMTFNRVRAGPRSDESYEALIIGAILDEIGERPLRPPRTGDTNAFLLFTKDYWYPCKAEADAAKREASGDPNAKGSRLEVRNAVGLKWRTASEEVRKPYIERADAAKELGVVHEKAYKEGVERWDREAARIRKEYIEKNPPSDGAAMAARLLHCRTSIELGAAKRRRV